MWGAHVEHMIINVENTAYLKIFFYSQKLKTPMDTSMVSEAAKLIMLVSMGVLNFCE